MKECVQGNEMVHNVPIRLFENVCIFIFLNYKINKSNTRNMNRMLYLCKEFLVVQNEAIQFQQ